MGDKSKIEWTDASWNPVTGCSKVSQGCKHCYAERVFPRAYGKHRKFTDVVCHPERLEQPLRWRKPRRIFVNSMSDLFHEAVPDSFIKSVFSVMAQADKHTFQILTKRPDRMLKLLSDLRCVFHRSENKSKYLPLDNVWLGVSVEDQATTNERIPLLLRTPAAVRFISAEPLLGPISLRKEISSREGPNPCAPESWSVTDWLSGFTGTLDHKRRGAGHQSNKIDWVIVGGESGPGARPMHPDWARSLRNQCKSAGVPYFFKQWGEWLPACAQYPETDAEHDETEEAGCYGDICMYNDGYLAEERFQPNTNGRPWLINRVGKKVAGRLLDGIEHSEYPA